MLRWQAFERSLSIPYLRAYLQGLPAFEDGDAEEQAFALVERHPNPIEALTFLVAWPALPRASTYVLHHWDQQPAINSTPWVESAYYHGF